MLQAVVLTYWEIKRLSRSRRALAVLLMIPALGIGICLLPWVNYNDSIRCFFPAAAGAFAWLVLCVRCISDRASGFAGGLESTPAAGGIVFISRFMVWLTVAAVQIALFYAAIRFVG